MGNLIVGILFLIGGLTGTLVLRGTGSSLALAALGVVLVIVGLVQINHRPTVTSVKKVRRNGRTRTMGRTSGTSLQRSSPRGAVPASTRRPARRR